MSSIPELTPIERRLLVRIQTGFPLVADPYAAIGDMLGIGAEESYALVLSLRERGIIRRIGGTFDAHRMGYVSALVAGRVIPEQLEPVAARVSEFSEVTHNYQRDDNFNLWFTIIAEQPTRLEEILTTVRSLEGVQTLHALPALRTFKIHVEFRFGEEERAVPTPETETTSIDLNMDERRIISVLCGDIGAERLPFHVLAEIVQLPVADLLIRMRRYQASGVMRRFGAVLRHQRAGYQANGMSVWNVPDAMVEHIASAMVTCPEVSHCYERPRLPDWPYNLFAMIHAYTPEDCQAVAARIAGTTHSDDYRLLFSEREFKKSSMVYGVRS